MTGTVHEDLNSFMVKYSSFLIRMKNISEKLRIQNQSINLR
jgi:hypothetical protein